MLDLLIKGGTIVDSHARMPGNVGVIGSRIVARFAPGEEPPAARETLDAEGLLVMPGIVDPHVHFYGEGIGEYSRLAVRGGVTPFMGMIRGEPEVPLATIVDQHRRDGLAASVTDFSFHVVLYDRHDSIAQIASLAQQGFLS